MTPCALRHKDLAAALDASGFCFEPAIAAALPAMVALPPEGAPGVLRMHARHDHGG